MAELVNLKLIRKRRARAEAERAAEDNRRKFGMSKAEKRRLAAEEARLSAELAGKKLTPD